jgi:hypothetical protein
MLSCATEGASATYPPAKRAYDELHVDSTSRSHAIARSRIATPSDPHVVNEAEGRDQSSGARDHGFRSHDRGPRFAARRSEPRRECPEYGHERRDCTSYDVGRRGDDNKGWGRTVGMGGAVPGPLDVCRASQSSNTIAP